jgi:hypothetical protein
VLRFVAGSPPEPSPGAGHQVALSPRGAFNTAVAVCDPNMGVGVGHQAVYFDRQPPTIAIPAYDHNPSRTHAANPAHSYVTEWGGGTAGAGFAHSVNSAGSPGQDDQCAVGAGDCTLPEPIFSEAEDEEDHARTGEDEQMFDTSLLEDSYHL